MNGFVGPYLASELSTHGYLVAGSDRAESCCIQDVGIYHSADLTDADAVEQAMGLASPDIVVNLAAVSSVGQSWKMPGVTMNVNVVGAVNVMEAARKLDNPPKIMLIGSSEEYAASPSPLDESALLRSNNPYGISKMTQEQLAGIYEEQFGLKIYRVRSFNHTGIGQRDTFVLPSFCKQVAQIERLGQAGTIQVGNIAVRRDFSDVRDVVRAYRMVVESDFSGEVFNIGSGIAHSLSELLDTIIGFCGQDVKVQVDPDRMRPSDTPISVCDHGKISRLLGWSPKHRIEQTLEEMYRSFLDMPGV